ncbi:MAG: N-(5'-phosphoribosyl)anthranilate isomerase [Cyclobacteriaceae bacterium]
MSLKSLVKLSNVNNLSDARYGAGMGVGMMGFPLDEGSSVSIEQFKEITSWVEGPQLVAEFDDPDTNRILEVISSCHPDIIQLRETNLLSALSHIEIPVILSWPIGKMEAVPQHFTIDYLLIEPEGNAELSTAQKETIKILAKDYKVLLGAGINPANVMALIEELPVEGLSLKGGDEIRAGYKDYDELADILELLEED